MRNGSMLFAFIFLASPARSRAAELSSFQKNAALFHLKCAKCHTVGRGDRVGPDLKGVSERRSRDWLTGFISDPDAYLDSDPEARKLLARFNGVRMENTQLSHEQVEGVLEYLSAAATAPVGPEEEPEPEEEDFTSKLKMPEEEISVSLPGIALSLFILAAAVALWQFGPSSAAALALLVACGAAYWSLGGRRHYRLLGNQQGYEPAQPIAYSHAKHAGELKISCLYCHYGAERSDVAGVPPAQVCMNCHAAVKTVKGASEPSPEIALLAQAWATRASTAPAAIEWTRVHDLPDFAHFSHRVHVANDIKCQECHGPVQTMTRMRQASSLSMGWCVNCHRLKAGAAPTHWKRTGGPLDCAACHW